MDLIHTTTCYLYNENIEVPFKVALISDVHFSYLVTDHKLDSITNYLIWTKPDYIFIAGDLIDSVDMIEDKSERERLLKWLNDLGEIAMTLISLGSHDYYKKDYYFNEKMKLKYHWKYYMDNEFIGQINNLNNVWVLDNDSYTDNNLYVAGITNSYSYYHPEYANHLKSKITEDKQKMLEELRNLRSSLTQNLPEDKINFAMIHSPIHLTDLEIKDELNEFDYFLSGHMHNGCVVPILYELWKSNKGLIAPNKSLLPSNVRDTLKIQGDKLVVNGPVTMFHECTGFMSKFNCFYPAYISILNITNDKKYDNKKLVISKKYNYINKKY